MTIPTLNELRQSIYADLRNRLQISTVIGKVVLNAFAMVHAGKLKQFYNQLAFIYKNIYPDTADSQSLGGTLERFGFIKLGRYPYPASAAEYLINVTGEIGAEIPVYTTFKTTDSSSNPGKTFMVDVLFAFSATSGQVTVRALELGTESELQASDQLQLTQPIADVNSYATVDSVITYPSDGETTEEYRELVKQAYRIEPQGGSLGDLRTWAQDAAFVRTVYPKKIYAGIVEVYVESVAAVGMTAASWLIEDVKDVIEYDPDTSKSDAERARLPVGVFSCLVSSVNLVPITVNIVGLSDVTLLSSIESSIAAFIYNVRPFVGGLDDARYQQKGYIYLADIYDIVRSVVQNDASFTSITLTILGSARQMYEFTGGNIPSIGSVTAS